jgi:hypothetical protein
MPRWLPRVLSRIHRLAAEGKVQFTEKALRELEALDLGLNEHDGAEVVLGCVVISFHSGESGDENED